MKKVKPIYHPVKISAVTFSNIFFSVMSKYWKSKLKIIAQVIELYFMMNKILENKISIYINDDYKLSRSDTWYHKKYNLLFY